MFNVICLLMDTKSGFHRGFTYKRETKNGSRKSLDKEIGSRENY